MTNNPAGNSAVQFRRASDGSLTFMAEVATGGLGGTGNGVGPLDPLGSQDSLASGPSGTVLLAVNAGSNQLSALSRTGGELSLLNTVSSGGMFPNSVAIHGDLVYVLNAHGAPNVSGFRVSPTTGLTPIPGSTRPLPGAAAAKPHDIRFSNDGTDLLVTEEQTNQIDVFEVGGDGLITGVTTTPAPGNGPFGMHFVRDVVVLITEANTGSVSSYRLNEEDMLDVITPAVPDGQRATCWISFTPDQKFAFVSNTGSGDLSSYQVERNGTLTLVNPVAGTAAGGAPIDSAFSNDTKFLYVDDSALGRVLIYRREDANLVLIGTQDGLPQTVQGIVAE